MATRELQPRDQLEYVGIFETDDLTYRARLANTVRPREEWIEIETTIERLDEMREWFLP